MKTEYVFFNNLPTFIKPEELQNELVASFSAFRRAHERGQSFAVEMYSDGKKCMAVVSGVFVDLDDLHVEAVQKTCQGRNWIFKRDLNDPRDLFGEFWKKLAPAKRRMYDYLSGISVRFLDTAFDSDFKRMVDAAFKCKRTVFLNQRIKYKHLINIFQGCLLENSISIIEEDRTRCNFVSALDALQALILCNGLEIGEGRPPLLFVDQETNTPASIKWRRGLGKKGELLNFRDLKIKPGYVKFENFAPNIFDVEKIQAIPSYCWKCESSYIIEGIDINLTFVAGKCKCLYKRSLDINSPDRAFFQNNEGFTRLTAGILENRKVTHWVIAHQTMQYHYESLAQYRNIIFPIVKEEWSYSTLNFKNLHATEGTFLSTHKIQVKKVDNSEYAVYGGIIEVTKTEFWSQANFREIAELTLTFVVKEYSKREVEEERVAKVLRITDEKSNNIAYLSVRFRLHPFQEPSKELRKVAVIPKPIKYEVEMIHRNLNKWKNKPENFPQFSVILSKEIYFEPAYGPPAVTLRKTKDRGQRKIMLEIMDTLNGEQTAALGTAIANPLSLVIGPPGTGKSYTAAVIGTFLRLEEQRVVLLTAPSNFACDGLTRTVSDLLQKFELNLSVLRVFSKKLGDEYLGSNDQRDFGCKVTSLHERVAKHPNYLAGENFKRIKELIRSKRVELMTEEDAEAYQIHIAELEWDIFSTADIIVCTVGVLADRRIREWNKSTRALGSVLLDEAGMLLQPNLLSVLDMHQKTTVLVGDPKQLSPVVTSYAAEITGYQLSALEWFEISGSRIPTVMLREQRRMIGPIRNLVSNLSYENELYDHPSVNMIPADLHKAFHGAFQTFAHIVVYKHNFNEEKLDHKIRNKGEAKLVIDMVSELRKHGLPDERFTVLSLYDWQRRYLMQKGVNAVNVDAFQGRENEIVILSMTRGGGSIGFSARLNRLNVALSRAKRYLVILINWSTFEKHKSQAVQKFLKHLQNFSVHPKSFPEIVIREVKE